MNALQFENTSKSFVWNHIKQVARISIASAAIIKLNIIRRALNLGENMEFTKGNIYYPYNPFITKSSTYYDNEIKEGLMSVVAEFEYKDQRYRLMGGVAGGGSASGLGSYGGVSFADSAVGFLGCATREIAQHFGKYFAKEIFDAKYGEVSVDKIIPTQNVLQYTANLLSYKKVLDFCRAYSSVGQSN